MSEPAPQTAVHLAPPGDTEGGTPFGTPQWLRALAEVTRAAGSPRFEKKLFALLNNMLRIDVCVVFTWSEQDGPGHLFTQGVLPREACLDLARDYVSKYYARDPQFQRVCAVDGTSALELFRPRLGEGYDPEYRRHFFLRPGLVDKFVAIERSDAGSIYCNFWRLRDTGPYAACEEARLRQVLPLITGLISTHLRLHKPVAAGNTASADGAARSLVHSVISRRVEPFDRLTAREAEICERILIGLTSLGISLDLGIAVTSVNTYRRRAYDKLGIASQNELFSLCLEALGRIRN